MIHLTSNLGTNHQTIKPSNHQAIKQSSHQAIEQSKPSMKLTKTGKLSIKLPPKLREPLILAAQQRLYYENEDLEHFSFFLLHEALQKMQRVSTNAIQFRLSEFFILLTPQTIQYLDEPTQILIRDAIEQRSKGTRIDISKMDDPEQVAALREFFMDPS